MAQGTSAGRRRFARACRAPRPSRPPALAANLRRKRGPSKRPRADERGYFIVGERGRGWHGGRGTGAGAGGREGCGNGTDCAEVALGSGATGLAAGRPRPRPARRGPSVAWPPWRGASAATAARSLAATLPAICADGE